MAEGRFFHRKWNSDLGPKEGDKAAQGWEKKGQVSLYGPAQWGGF
jgi:hypothetical protein